MLGADDPLEGLDQDDVREELKMELALLNAALKKLDPHLDLADIIKPLLSDQGPAIAAVPKLKKQIGRMTKIRDELLQKRAANTQGRMSVVPEPAGPSAACAELGTEVLRTATPPAVSLPRARLKRGPSVAQSTPDIFVAEVQPAWGPLKRFEAGLDQRRYDACVKCARLVFDHMRSAAHPGGPRECKQRCSGFSDILIDDRKVVTFFTNRYLQFENIRTAAQDDKFDNIQIAYYRNEALAQDRITANKNRQKFIHWAADLLRSRSASEPPMDQRGLLAAWDALTEIQRKSVTTLHPKNYFVHRYGVKLTMQHLQDIAFQGENADSWAGDRDEWSMLDLNGDMVDPSLYLYL